MESQLVISRCYRCELDIDFPENEKEQDAILKNIEEILSGIPESSLDLEFVRELTQDGHEEEIVFMNFEQLSSQDLRELPWFLVKFTALSLTKGSTVLTFKLTFEKPPENFEDVNVY